MYTKLNKIQVAKTRTKVNIQKHIEKLCGAHIGLCSFRSSGLYYLQKLTNITKVLKSAKNIKIKNKNKNKSNNNLTNNLQKYNNNQINNS
jgi:hypothetical protein